MHRRTHLIWFCRHVGLFVLLAAVASACVPVNDTDMGSFTQPSTALPSAVEIYNSLSPSLAYVETPIGTGSGVLTELQGKKYVVTNADVVWPFSEAHVIFSDQDEFLETPLVQTDQLVDLAILGPIDTTLPTLDLDTQMEPVPGETVYLIGYPGEGELYPVPTISEGILSRTRVWDAQDSLRYFQTDAASAGGQSGGVLVSAQGDVIGISGMLFAEAFTLAASSADLTPHAERLAATGPSGPIRAILPSAPLEEANAQNSVTYGIRRALYYLHQSPPTWKCKPPATAI